MIRPTDLLPCRHQTLSQAKKSSTRRAAASYVPLLLFYLQRQEAIAASDTKEVAAGETKEVVRKGAPEKKQRHAAYGNRVRALPTEETWQSEVDIPTASISQRRNVITVHIRCNTHALSLKSGSRVCCVKTV